MEKIFFSKIVPLIIVLGLAFVAGFALLHPGLPPTHDGEYHVVRFYEFDKVFRSGTFYPRWAPDLNRGYGLPLFNYVYPLPNYIAAAMHGFGISFIDAVKYNMFAATMFGAFFMYLWVRLFFGNWGGLTASVLYTYSPYHFLDIYIRGSVGEVWALALFPAMLWSITKLLKYNNMSYLPISAIFLALIIFSHNILSLMFFPFLLSYMGFLLIKQKRSKFWYVSLIVIILGLSLSSIFWLPALWERDFVVGLGVFDYRSHFVEIYQLIFPSWGSGFSADAATQGLSFQIGIANLFVLFFLICMIPFIRKHRQLHLIIFFLFWCLLTISLMLPLSTIVWEKFTLMRYFQFPWRLLSLVILCIGFLAGSLGRRKLIALFLIAISLVFGIGYANVAYYHMRDDSYYTARANFIEGTNSPGNAFNTRWFNQALPKAANRIEKDENLIKVNTAYFPGWQVFVNGEAIETTADKDGVIAAKRPNYDGDIQVKFLDTPARTAANVISLASLGILSLLLLKNMRVRMGL